MPTDSPTIVTIAIVGGTGKEGTGLALRWALHGYRVLIGSRDAVRAADHAKTLNERLGADFMSGMSNGDAVAQADFVVLSVPYAGQKDTLDSIKDQLDGKILIDIVVPNQPPKIRTAYVPPGHSAAQEAQEQLGSGVRVVAAFHNVSSDKMQEPDTKVDCDVLVTGGDESAKADVLKLVEAIGLRGFDAGPLANSVAAEALTAVLLSINKKYGVKGSGIRITGV
jgi:NADPH-dependent F420 reductase